MRLLTAKQKYEFIFKSTGFRATDMIQTVLRVANPPGAKDKPNTPVDATGSFDFWIVKEFADGV
jgi:hypothetical protein